MTLKLVKIYDKQGHSIRVDESDIYYNKKDENAPNRIGYLKCSNLRLWSTVKPIPIETNRDQLDDLLPKPVFIGPFEIYANTPFNTVPITRETRSTVILFDKNGSAREVYHSDIQELMATGRYTRLHPSLIKNKIS